MQIGDITAVIEYAILILFYIIMAQMVIIFIPRAMVCIRRVQKVLNMKERIADENTLNDLSFVCKKGETTAIIGSSGSGKSTIAGLIMRFFDVTNGKILLKNDVKIVKNEASKITLEEYKTDNFTMKKPTGWNVETGGTGIFYAIRVYNPRNSNNQIYLMLKVQPLLKSTSAKTLWQNYYNLSGNNAQYKLFADAVVLDNPTTEGVYKKFDEISTYLGSIEPTLSTMKFPKFSNFTKIEEFDSSAGMKSVALDSKVLRGIFTGENSKEGEGLFMASIVNFGNQYNDDGYIMDLQMIIKEIGINQLLIICIQKNIWIY